MEYKTSISKLNGDDHTIRGERLETLVEEGNFSNAIFFLLRGVKPSAAESTLFAAMLIASIDHGMGTASSMTTRFVASTGNSINTAVGGGILALGEFHGGAIEKAMEQLQTFDDSINLGEWAKEFVAHSIENKTIIYGFGHKIHKDRDPRTKQLIELASSVGYQTKYLDLCLAIEKELKIQKEKAIPLNVDGVMAALLLGMGFDPITARGVFIIGRTPGLVAQAVEEITAEKPVRRVDESEINYQGK